MSEIRQGQVVGRAVLTDKETGQEIKGMVLSGTTGDMNGDVSGSLLLTAGAGATTIPFGSVTTAKIFNIKARNNTSKAARQVTLTLEKTGGATFAIQTTDFLYISTEGEQLIGATVAPQAAGAITEVEYMLAGN